MIRCLIVDDESLARELIANYLRHFEDFVVVGECKTAMEAIQFLAKSEVDLMFLDINMPQISGIEILKQMPQKPMTVLCTAYSEYALEGYELEVLDYLLKPIAFDRFTKTIGKVLKNKGVSNSFSQESKENMTPFFVKSEYKKIKIVPSEIKYVEAMEKYVRIHLSNERVMTLMSMSSMMDLLNKNHFIRVHRSFIVNTRAIDAIEGNMVVIGAERIPVSKANRKLIQDLVNGLGPK